VNARLWTSLVLQRAIGSRTGRAYGEFAALRGLSRVDLDALQRRRLAGVLAEAVAHVEYYRRRVTSHRAPELSDFPILAKPDIREHFDQLRSDALARSWDARRLAYSWTLVKTGGSTGMPVTVVHDRAFRDRGRASRLFSQDLCGFPFGTPYVKLWGSMEDLSRVRALPGRRLLGWLGRELPRNAFRMSDDDMARYAGEIARLRVRYMMAYVDAAHQLARHVRRTGVDLRLDAVMACAGTVTGDARRDIAAAFGARVHNKYGSRECGDMACECPDGGLHIYTNNVAVEVVDDQGRPLAPGETGRLLVTLLGNTSFPLIRYEIGDIGALSAGACTCGLATPLLARVEGRLVERLVGAGGAYVSPVFVRHLIGVVHNDGIVRRFQLVQQARDRFDLKLEVEAGVPEARFDDLRRRLLADLRRVLGQDATIAIARVPSIPEQAGGKFLYCVNRSSAIAAWEAEQAGTSVAS
jgi:phenylacetate-CoA ligase